MPPTDFIHFMLNTQLWLPLLLMHRFKAPLLAHLLPPMLVLPPTPTQNLSALVFANAAYTMKLFRGMSGMAMLTLNNSTTNSIMHRASYNGHLPMTLLGLLMKAEVLLSVCLCECVNFSPTISPLLSPYVLLDGKSSGTSSILLDGNKCVTIRVLSTPLDGKCAVTFSI
jgi:hypothetical protein